ncbi:EEF1A lysine methyltransferase 2 [Geodia barretti]|nr:EEF1A lysine methyltransferase 2 [Geodia barretti]
MELAEDGFEELTGIDYSPAAIELAKQVADTDLHSHNIQFLVVDVLHVDDSLLHQTNFDVILDKGTYDAISLDPLGAEEKRSRYIRSVSALLANGGIFLITSCNWTREELTKHFDQMLSPEAVIPAPTLQFGGKTGQTVTSLVLQKHS